MNVITIELCAEDRARIDRLTEALERKACDSCLSSALSWAEQVQRGAGIAANNAVESDSVQQALANTLAKVKDPAVAPENAPHAPSDASAAQTTHPASEDLPWAEKSAPAVKVPSLEEFQKALTLRCAESEETKAKVRALLHEYAPAASRVPEEKRAEVMERLAKL